MPIDDYKKYWQTEKGKYDELLKKHIANLKKDFAECVKDQKALNTTILKEAAEHIELEKEKKDITAKLKGIKPRPKFGLEAAAKDMHDAMKVCEKLINVKGKKEDSKTLIAAGKKLTDAQKRFAEAFKKVRAYAEGLRENPAYEGAIFVRRNPLFEAASTLMRDGDSRALVLYAELQRRK